MSAAGAHAPARWRCKIARPSAGQRPPTRCLALGYVPQHWSDTEGGALMTENPGGGHDGLLQLPCAIPGPRRCLCPTCGQVLNAPQVPSWAQFAATAPIQEKSGIDRVSAFEAVRISQTSSQKQDYGSTTLALFFHQAYRAARLSPRSKACNRTLVAGSDCSIQVMRSPLLSVAS